MTAGHGRACDGLAPGASPRGRLRPPSPTLRPIRPLTASGLPADEGEGCPPLALPSRLAPASGSALYGAMWGRVRYAGEGSVPGRSTPPWRRGPGEGARAYFYFSPDSSPLGLLSQVASPQPDRSMIGIGIRRPPGACRLRQAPAGLQPMGQPSGTEQLRRHKPGDATRTTTCLLFCSWPGWSW